MNMFCTVDQIYTKVFTLIILSRKIFTWALLIVSERILFYKNVSFAVLNSLRKMQKTQTPQTFRKFGNKFQHFNITEKEDSG